eukprot:6195466-Pleurochrysis_carterae.AAC.1
MHYMDMTVRGRAHEWYNLGKGKWGKRKLGERGQGRHESARLRTRADASARLRRGCPAVKVGLKVRKAFTRACLANFADLALSLSNTAIMHLPQATRFVPSAHLNIFSKAERVPLHASRRFECMLPDASNACFQTLRMQDSIDGAPIAIDRISEAEVPLRNDTENDAQEKRLGLLGHNTRGLQEDVLNFASDRRFHGLRTRVPTTCVKGFGREVSCTREMAGDRANEMT